MSDEFKEILEEVDALKTEHLADESNARPRREASQSSLPDGTERQKAVQELISEAREYAAFESAAQRPKWFGPIEQLVLAAGIWLDPVLEEADRILAEAAACRHPFNCRCHRQLKLYEERIAPALKEWGEFDVYAEALRKK